MAVSVFAYDSGGGKGGGPDEEIHPCLEGLRWNKQMQECVSRQWVIKSCYTAFSPAIGEDYYASCQEGTGGGILMECGAVSYYQPLYV